MKNRLTGICGNFYFKAVALSVLLWAASITGQSKVYTESDEIFPNPERGFSDYQNSRITADLANTLRNQGITVVQRIYTIPEFNNSALSDEFLQLVRDDLNAAREGGLKVVMRFSYTNDQNGADAPLDTILYQINQLAPVLRDNYDVIAYMEAGFIGAWGEWYYSSHHLNNTEDRRTVLYALLDALPEERCVVIRTPEYKRQIFGTSDPLSEEEAFNGSKRARTGAHNDCFLADATDYGTYLDVETDKNYLHLDNRYVPQGGETCNPSSYSVCGNALIDLARMRWSVLNKDYNMDVLNGWETGGCMDEIKRRLGYRFVLLDAVTADTVKPGGEFKLDFNLLNRGFASPYNPRILEVILRDTVTRKTYRLVSNADPRFWLPEDTVRVGISGGIPPDMPVGTYEMMLHFADPVDTLRYRPEYAIRLANENIWEDSTGYNRMNYYLSVAEREDLPDYSGNDIFEEFYAKRNPGPPPQSDIVIDGDFGDWSGIPQLDTGADAEEAGDALNSSVDLLDLWITHNADYLYISYRLAGNYSGGYFYHVFFDVDNNPDTGFHSGGSYGGFDIMIENESIWKYSGTNGEWGWTAGGSVNQIWVGDRVEMSIDRSAIGLSDNAASIELVFNINDNDENHDDDYAPNAFQQRNFVHQLDGTGIRCSHCGIVPESMALKIYPNPFNGRVAIEIELPLNKIERADIFNLKGQRVKSFGLPELRQKRLFWDGNDERSNRVSTGIYFFRIKTNDRVYVRKLLMIK
jgi:hypothetical protein